MSYGRGIRRYFVGHERRWDRYNRSLVERSFDLLSTLFFRHWDMLLEEINAGKRGRPFSVPNALIAFLAKLRAMFSISIRVLKSVAKTYCILTGKRCIHYSGIFKRIRRMRPVLAAHTGSSVDAAIDSTGLKITIRGDYLGTKWKRKGWNKLHVVISLYNISVLAFTITDEHGSDPTLGKKLIADLAARIRRLFADCNRRP